MFNVDVSHHSMVLPISTATVRRYFSDMKQIKDCFVLSTSLSKLMIIVEGPPLAKVDFDAALSLWKSMKSRWILL